MSGGGESPCDIEGDVSLVRWTDAAWRQRPLCNGRGALGGTHDIFKTHCLFHPVLGKALQTQQDWQCRYVVRRRPVARGNNFATSVDGASNPRLSSPHFRAISCGRGSVRTIVIAEIVCVEARQCQVTVHLGPATEEWEGGFTIPCVRPDRLLVDVVRRTTAHQHMCWP
jgi:hypothetical protein